MGNLVLSAFVVAVLIGGYSYMKTQNTKIADDIKTAKTVDTYIKKAKIAEENNLADPEYRIGMVAVTNSKDLLFKLKKAMNTALKTKDNPTCQDLAKTGVITYDECKKAEKIKAPVIVFNNGNIQMQNMRKENSALKTVIAYRIGNNQQDVKNYINRLKYEDSVSVADVQTIKNIKTRANMVKTYVDMTKAENVPANIKNTVVNYIHNTNIAMSGKNENIGSKGNTVLPITTAVQQKSINQMKNKTDSFFNKGGF